MDVAAVSTTEPKETVMRVAELTAFHVRIPLRKAIRHASHTRTETDNLVVRCVLENGVQGYGEGVPRDYVTGETIDSTLHLLRRSNLPGQLGSCGELAQAVTSCERLRLAVVDNDVRQIQGNAARCAVELALLDAWCKHFGEPVSTITRILAAEIYRPQQRIRYSTAITSARGWKLRVSSWLMRVYGFRQLKLKVGIAGYDDVDRLRKIRRRVGSMDIRLDANEAWTPANVADRILELKPFGISAVEQPVPHDDVGCLAEVRRLTGVPIMHDESLCGMVDAEQAVANATCDLFNLRLSKCGGFIPSLRLAQFAKRHGLGCQLGCQIGETAILSAAGRHFACSVADLRYLEGSYDRHLVREALATRDITFGWGGLAAALAGPGLGVDVDPLALERVTIRKETLLG